MQHHSAASTMMANYSPNEQNFELGLDPTLLFHNPSAATVAAGGAGVGTGRPLPKGTVSMPTSPLMHQSQVTRTANQQTHMNMNLDPNLWNVPHTAQPYFGLTSGSTTSTNDHFFPEHASPLELEISPQAQAWYDHHTTSTSNQNFLNSAIGNVRIFGYENDPLHLGWDNTHTHTLTQSNKRGKLDQEQEQDHEEEAEGGNRGYGPGGRKKRAQVRIACTHCQKACKKCSNTRPCERCVKYGLQDCVDSTRKARKTGVKRRPYKRRSSKFDQHQHQHEHPHQSSQPRRQSNNQNTHSFTDVNVILNEKRYSDVPPPQPQRQQLFHQTTTSTQSNIPNINEITDDNDTNIGNDNGDNDILAQAISSALINPQKPKWINGQRLSNSTSTSCTNQNQNQKNGIPSPMYPRTPIGPFPLTLNNTHSQIRGGDPFSRAVSPIHSSSLTATATRAVFGKEEWVHPQESDEYDNDDDDVNNLIEGMTQSQSSVLIDTNMSIPLPQAKSQSKKSPPTLSQSQSQSQGNGTYTTLSYPLPKKIRKPSLRTLISTTTSNSTATSRAQSPISQQQQQQFFQPLSHIRVEEEEEAGVVERIQSPTLFDQPMRLDDDALRFLNYKLENWSNSNQSQLTNANITIGNESGSGENEHGESDMFSHKDNGDGDGNDHGNGYKDGDAGGTSMISFDSLVQL